MAKLDCYFTKVTADSEDDKERFLNGIDIFSSQPACVGFMVSTAILMLGRPGSTQPKAILNEKWNGYRESFEQLLTRMENMTNAELKAFLALPMLSEKLASRKSSKVGDFEREFFKTAFTTLYEEGVHLTSFEICWNAY